MSSTPHQPTATTPLIPPEERTLPTHNGQVQDYPIFLRVCHSPWRFISQGSLVFTRAFILVYLTVVAGMLLHYKRDKQIQVLGEGDESDEKPYSAWESAFQFSTIAFLLLWLFHFISFCWSFTHLYYPNFDERDQHSWEAILLNKMSPPTTTIHSRKRLYFSLFYTAAHVFVLMNALIYWAVLVPKGKGQWPGEHHDDHDGDHDGDDEKAWMPSTDDLFGHGWFEPFCIINLWGVTALLGLLEIFGLNSVKPQTPVATHVFALMFILSGYLGWASFGHVVTGKYAFFWLDKNEMKHTELMAAWSSGFVLLGPTRLTSTVFAIMYGLTWLRQYLTKRGKPDPVHFNAIQFARDIANDIAHDAEEEFRRATGQTQR
ncbi:hypothetical protein B0T18DRAFT_490343 [Schizothecium vesticola]|uniref:Uncharacterized protein n=1 Tax=Schizothecium vesticola TaxID=314040 RepID=A0AA40EQQ6_9PEZI|nr:hypothetical protein B0T18DRAFT_490343 [Schizothecium vesticola]